MYQRIGAPAYKADLNNTIMLMEMTGNPHQSLKCVHIAGTNGKGSVSHMIASVLQECGLKTGLYTSPHLFDYRERIRINGKKIPEQYVVEFINKYKKKIEAIQPSFFEISVALAYSWFRDEKVDIAVIETGMGGRLDSTNVIIPVLSVITNISYDHMMFLGDTLEQIAFEKAGIIKEGVPVVIGESDKKTLKVFKRVAEMKNAPLKRADKNYYFLKNDAIIDTLSGNLLSKGKIKIANISCPLLGEYQKKNIVTVVKALQMLKNQGYPIRKKLIKRGIANVISNTSLMGRFDVVNLKPKVICDVAHNYQGLEVVFRQIQSQTYARLHVVFGMNNDKNPAEMMSLLPANAVYYFCKAKVPRAMDVAVLAEQAEALQLKYLVFPTVKAAFQAAMKNADKENDLIFCGGSTFVVAEIPMIQSKYSEEHVFKG